MHRKLCLWAVLLISLFGISSAYAADTIKIGAVLSVTGPASFLGEPEKNTLLMLQEKINSQGGISGKKLEIVIYDDETDVNKCVLAVDKLLKKDQVVAGLGPTTSGNTLAVMDKFAKAKVPLISFSAAEKIVKPINPYIFKNPPSDRLAVMNILKHAKAHGYKKIAIITVSDGFGQAGREVLKELVPAQGFELVGDEVYGPKDTDMSAQLTKIKGLNPDAVVCWGTNPGPAVIARNRVQLGIKTPLYMSHGVASKKFIELAGEAAEGLILPASALIVADQIDDRHPQKKVLMDYTKEYQAKFNSPVSTFGGHGYDGIAMLVKAIEMGKSHKPADIRDNLEKIRGLVGTAGVFNFSPTDHNGLDESAFTMIVIRNGNWQIIK